MGKGEIARNEQFLLFPQCFLPFWRTFCHFHQIQNCRLQSLSVWKSLIFVVWERVKNLAPYIKSGVALVCNGMVKFSFTTQPGEFNALRKKLLKTNTSLHSSVVRAFDLKTRGCWFNSRAGQPNNYLSFG